MSDIIDKPPHYIDGRTIEPVDAIEDWRLNWHLGNAVKYISRTGRKDYAGGAEKSSIADLDKALWYVLRYRNQLAKIINVARKIVVEEGKSNES